MRATIVAGLVGVLLTLPVPNGASVPAAPRQDQAAPEKEAAPKKETAPKEGKDGPRVSPLTKSECEKLGGVIRADRSCPNTNHVCIIPYSASSACVDDMSK